MFKLSDRHGLIAVGSFDELLIKSFQYYNSIVSKYLASDWLRFHDCSLEEIGLKEDDEILFESKYDDIITDEILKQLKFTSKYVFSFIILKNGKAIVLNEHPSIGYTFTIVNKVFKKLDNNVLKEMEN